VCVCVCTHVCVCSYKPTHLPPKKQKTKQDYPASCMSCFSIDPLVPSNLPRLHPMTVRCAKELYHVKRGLCNSPWLHPMTVRCAIDTCNCQKRPIKSKRALSSQKSPIKSKSKEPYQVKKRPIQRGLPSQSRKRPIETRKRPIQTRPIQPVTPRWGMHMYKCQNRPLRKQKRPTRKQKRPSIILGLFWLYARSLLIIGKRALLLAYLRNEDLNRRLAVPSHFCNHQRS